MNWFRPWLAHSPIRSVSLDSKQQNNNDETSMIFCKSNDNDNNDHCNNSNPIGNPSSSSSSSSTTVITTSTSTSVKEIDNFLKKFNQKTSNPNIFEDDVKSKYYSFYYNYYYNQLLMQNYCSVMIKDNHRKPIDSKTNQNPFNPDHGRSFSSSSSSSLIHHNLQKQFQSDGLSFNLSNELKLLANKSIESNKLIKTLTSNDDSNRIMKGSSIQSNSSITINHQQNTFQSFILQNEPYCSRKNSSNKSSTTDDQSSQQRPKKFICVECQNGFSNRSQLNSHIRTHTGERPFVCDFKNCHKSFTRNEELTRHRRIHSGIRPYQCRWCEKRFGRKDHLRKHERTHERRLRSALFLNYASVGKSHQIHHGSTASTDLVTKLEENCHQSILYLANEINKNGNGNSISMNNFIKK